MRHMSSTGVSTAHDRSSSCAGAVWPPLGLPCFSFPPAAPSKMGGWAALCLLLLRLACEARPAASALQLGAIPKGPPFVIDRDRYPTGADIGVMYRVEPDSPDRSSPTVLISTLLDNWWKDTVDETLVVPKGHPLGPHGLLNLYNLTDSNGNAVLNTAQARWNLSDDITLRVQLASPQKAHRLGEQAAGKAGG